MKKRILIILLMALIMPLKVYAAGDFSVTPTTITMNPGNSKTITIKSNNSVGKLDITTSNQSVAAVSSSSIFIQNPGSSQNITITAGSIGTATISVIGTGQFSTMDEEILEGLTRTITVKVVAPQQAPVTPQPGNGTNNSNTNTNTNSNSISTTNGDMKKSNDATLSELKLSSGSINFSKDKTEYTTEVSYDVEKIIVTAKASNEKAKVEIPENIKLKLGKNEIVVKVTAEDGTTKNYKIVVKRLDRKLSNNAYINSIKIKGYKIEFKKDTYSYVLGDIKKDKLDIEVTLEDENAKYKVYGNNNIGEDDAIVIKVTAEDKTIKEYIIYVNNINTKKSNNKVKVGIIVSVITILLVSIPIVVGIINEKRKLND